MLARTRAVRTRTRRRMACNTRVVFVGIFERRTL